jgi:hypothetical protein
MMNILFRRFDFNYVLKKRHSRKWRFSLIFPLVFKYP